jgi:dihydroxy-acid dehydratase
VTGRTLGEELTAAPAANRDLIAPLDAPFGATGSISVVRGSLAPRGALVKRCAASPSLLRHRGPAVVFDDVHDVAARIDDPALDVTAADALVMKNAGPLGAPGMPEAGYLPIPRKLSRTGVKDMLRISDARMSGTAYGSVILHVTPEAAAGGPLGLVRNGDRIRVSVKERRLDLLVDDAELARRRAAARVDEPRPRRGYRKLFFDHVLQADQGCDFDFLRHPDLAPPPAERRVP